MGDPKTHRQLSRPTEGGFATEFDAESGLWWEMAKMALELTKKARLLIFFCLGLSSDGKEGPLPGGVVRPYFWWR